MTPREEKREAFQTAQELLQNRAANLKYVALELRCCLEAIVYDKLLLYGNRIPAAARAWQPPQAFKALMVLEPDAATTFTMYAAVEKAPGIPEGPLKEIGTDHRPSPAWLTKTYNKLGNLLHAHSPFVKGNGLSAAEIRQYLESVARDLEPYFDVREINAAMAMTVDFECSVCGSTVVANSAGVKHAGEVTCLSCGCRHFVEERGEDLFFHLDASSAQCECGAEISIPNQKAMLGYKFTCANCGSEFEIAQQTWGFKKIIVDSGPVDRSA